MTNNQDTDNLLDRIYDNVARRISRYEQKRNRGYTATIRQMTPKQLKEELFEQWMNVILSILPAVGSAVMLIYIVFSSGNPYWSYFVVIAIIATGFTTMLVYYSYRILQLVRSEYVWRNRVQSSDGSESVYRRATRQMLP